MLTLYSSAPGPPGYGVENRGNLFPEPICTDLIQFTIQLLHELEEHYGETVNATSWKLLGAHDVIAAKEQEVKTKKRPPPDLLCMKCNNWTTYSFAQIQKHLVSQ